MAPPKQKAAAGRKRKIVSSESESTPPDSSSSDEAGPSRARNTKAVRQVLNDSDDGSSTLSNLSIANSTKPKNCARKSTATRPRAQSSSSDQSNSIGASRPTRPGQNTATTSRRHIESDSEEDSEEERQKSKKVNTSKQNNSNKAAPNRTARQLNFAASAQNKTPTPRKRGRPPLKAKLTTATRDSSSSGTRKAPAATIASDDSSDEEIVRPTPNARNNIEPRNFSPISKKLGPYSPFKKPSDVLTSDTKKQLVNSCIHYLLIVDQKKYAIKKTDLKKNIFKDNCSAKVFNEVILEVNKTLKQVFGLELMELENKKDQYMIHNNLHNALELAEFSEKMQAERGLLIYLLTLIFMNGNAILEEDLWTTLKTFQLFRDPKKPHPCFGEVSKFLDKLERQMYLERAKIPNTEPTLSEYKWGLRAKLEVRKTDLLEFACEAYGDCKPEDWILQFKETTLENEDSNED